MKPWFSSVASLHGHGSDDYFEVDINESREVVRAVKAAQGGLTVRRGDDFHLTFLVGNSGRPQPVVWPMTLHVHDQDCGRS